MLNDRVKELINIQINKELASAYLYLDFANYFNERGLTGFEHWYKEQAREEIEHAEKFIDYLHDENEKVELETIEKLDCLCVNDIDVLQNGLRHEKYVTELINNIYAVAADTEDLRTMNFLEWFIAEQAEEEKNANELITRYELFAGDCAAGLYMLDKELSER